MNVEILYFAAARERAGCGAERLEVLDGATVDDVLQAIVARHSEMVALLPYVRVARNEVFVSDHQVVVSAGDVLALIPPVAGGAPKVLISDLTLDARAVEALVEGPDRGGLVTFIGVVRDHTGDHQVTRLEYEAYASMATRVLEDIVAEVEAGWPGVRVAVHHRVGVLTVGEAAVVVCASASHRADAFAACAKTIDRLKEDVPIFKREVRTDGSVWMGMGP